VKTLVLTIAAVAFLAVGASQALAHPSSPPAKTVTVAMHDPGCHWFVSNGMFVKTLNVTGPVKLANFDEKALIVAGAGSVKHDAVGKVLTLAPGTYHITMVGQAPDDNHLKLVVR
jgi:hypothetical protein